MEKEGVKLDLANKDPSVEGFDAVYMPPTLPNTAPIAKKVADSDLKVLTNEEFSNYFSTFESYQLVREWLKEPEEWEDDIRLIAEQNGLEEGVDEVIALLKD